MDVDEARLSQDELVSVALVLLLAGYEASVSLIGIGSYLMLRHREQLDVLKADPTLWPNAVEEVLRLYAPPETTTRAGW